MSVSTGDSSCHNHLMHVPFALGLQPTHLLRCLLLPVWEDCLLSVAMSKLLYICIHLLLNYTQNVGSPYTCPKTEGHSYTHTMQNKSNSDWYNRLYVTANCTCAHTVLTSCGGQMWRHLRYFTRLNHKNNFDNTSTGTRLRVTCWTLPWMSAGTG